MLERLRGHLRYHGGTADVMAESRGGKEDRELMATYSEVYTRGTFYRSPGEMQEVLSSKDLKVKKKETNIAGRSAGSSCEIRDPQ